MRAEALEGPLSAAVWLIFAFGCAWLLFGAVLALADTLAYRRRVTVPADCQALNDEPGGVVRHLLSRSPVAGEDRKVLLRAKGVVAEVGSTVLISYDLKRPHQVFLASHHPRFEHLRGEVLAGVIGALPILYVLIRWVIS
ncbi:hypothetical protein [Streptomyces syringium]|uniref:DUF3592 domain-containing protein n=1 Tax=Streptomyces syringium TaxID=76729 RepID=A0ABS4Y467_9ACTN|nr:hypothetical protein [Streptomyces syringium]MBP2403567.1 hypothetical protein [Streptomyces syringium]